MHESKGERVCCGLGVGGGGLFTHLGGRCCRRGVQGLLCEETPETVCLMDLKGWHARRQLGTSFFHPEQGRGADVAARLDALRTR